MKFTKIRKEDFEGWLQMGLKLWPKCPEKKLRKEFLDILPSKQAILCKDNGEYAGFINISMRKEHVPGASSPSVGYVEGLYVKEKYRKKGIAKKLLEHAEKWAKSKGCKEIGSDTWVWNKASRNFHKKLGFKESEILVHFIKKI